MPPFVDAEVLSHCKSLVKNTLVALEYINTGQDLQLHHVTSMTHLTSLEVWGETLFNAPIEAGDKLTLLTHLARLHTLTLCNFLEPQLNLVGLQSLRELCLSKCHPWVYDLAVCTQLPGCL